MFPTFDRRAPARKVGQHRPFSQSTKVGACLEMSGMQYIYVSGPPLFVFFFSALPSTRPDPSQLDSLQTYAAKSTTRVTTMPPHTQYPQDLESGLGSSRQLQSSDERPSTRGGPHNDLSTVATGTALAASALAAGSAAAPFVGPAISVVTWPAAAITGAGIGQTGTLLYRLWTDGRTSGENHDPSSEIPLSDMPSNGQPVNSANSDAPNAATRH